ncbi:hypothetical protein K505DRAFT_418113 [Melanomma pulvis-pyrius CBS 109.77]|uniref:DUF7730 domain-containing protein n=1 Tax=Melanomma pulvis-pyrius CBS 109.77 TaxID=1314802 RepID=A0A6A6XAB3_9PLEO|nr:hypothetical protein K505DRAFT_418113 [Melanomma pulvis-pyrius CBS 109.77]
MTSRQPPPTLLFLIPILIWWLIEDRMLDRWNARPPKTRARKRRLTLPLDENTEEGNLSLRAKLREQVRKSKTEQQGGSMLFSLPVELRQIVYQEYLGDGEIWIVLTESGKLRGFRNLGSSTEVCEERVGVDIMPLLLTCRKTYSELISLIYLYPIYTFLDPFSFFAFSALLIPRRFHCITKVHIDLLTLPPNDLISLERHARLNERLSVSYKLVRKSTRHRFHNALPREKGGKEQKKTLWDKMLEIIGAMEGLRRLQVDVNLDRFGMFQLTSLAQQRRKKKRLRDLLELGIEKTAEMELHVANHVEDGEVRGLEWRPMTEGRWRESDGDIILDAEIEECFEEMAAFKVLLKIGRKAG